MVVGFCFFFFIHLESSGVREVGGASFLTTKKEEPRLYPLTIEGGGEGNITGKSLTDGLPALG